MNPDDYKLSIEPPIKGNEKNYASFSPSSNQITVNQSMLMDIVENQQPLALPQLLGVLAHEVTHAWQKKIVSEVKQFLDQKHGNDQSNETLNTVAGDDYQLALLMLAEDLLKARRRTRPNWLGNDLDSAYRRQYNEQHAHYVGWEIEKAIADYRNENHGTNYAYAYFDEQHRNRNGDIVSVGNRLYLYEFTTLYDENGNAFSFPLDENGNII